MNLTGITLVIAFHGFALAAALTRIKFDEKRIYKWLSVLIFLLSAILVVSPDSKIIPETIGEELSSVFYFLIGPALFAFISELTASPLSRKFILSLISPAIIITILFLGTYIPLFYNKETIYKAILYLYDFNWLVSAFLELYCIIVSYIAIEKSKIRAEQISAGNDSLLVGRLNLFVSVYTVFFAIDFLQSVIGLFIQLPVIIEKFIPPIFDAVWFALIAYLLIVGAEQYKKLNKNSKTAAKYEKTGLSELEAYDLFQQTQKFMDAEKFYLNTDCTLPLLSQKMLVTTHDLSQAINSGSSRNFAGFINGYRVNHAKELLSVPDNLEHNFLEIAHNSGFSSKATFNRVFKEITGETPTSFRKKMIHNK